MTGICCIVGNIDGSAAQHGALRAHLRDRRA
jgi:hypothetical protein